MTVAESMEAARAECGGGDETKREKGPSKGQLKLRQFLSDQVKKYDQDKTGNLSRAEVMQLLTDSDHSSPAGTAPTDEELNFCMRFGDRDKRGTICAAELEFVISAWNTYKRNKDDMIRAVKEFDEEGELKSGKLEREELRKYLAKEWNGGWLPTDTELDWVIKQADVLSDGALSHVELAQAICAFNIRPYYAEFLKDGTIDFTFPTKILFGPPGWEWLGVGTKPPTTVVSTFLDARAAIDWCAGDKIKKINGKKVAYDPNLASMAKIVREHAAKHREDGKPLEIEVNRAGGFDKPDVRLAVYSIPLPELVIPHHPVLYVTGTGLYHVGVVAYGNEWGYGALVNPRHPKATGIHVKPPGAHPHVTFKEFINLGPTSKSREEVAKIVMELTPEWIGSEYNCKSNNCVDFAKAFVAKLGCPGEVPVWCGIVPDMLEKVDAFNAKVQEGLEETAKRAKAKLGELKDSMDSMFYWDEDADGPEPSPPEAAEFSKEAKGSREKMLREIFGELDKNDDSTISLAEYRRLSSSKHEGAMDAFFDAVDKENKADGQISQEEFVNWNMSVAEKMTDAQFEKHAKQWLSLAKTNRRKLLEEIFAQLDKNGDGSLSLREYRKLNNLYKDKAFIDMVFKVIDAEKSADGKISQEEFVKFNLASGKTRTDAEFEADVQVWLSLAKKKSCSCSCSVQ